VSKPSLPSATDTKTDPTSDFVSSFSSEFTSTGIVVEVTPVFQPEAS
jgi:hypothetical protein